MLLLRIINLGLFLELREHISRRIRPRLKDGLPPTTQDQQTLTPVHHRLDTTPFCRVGTQLWIFSYFQRDLPSSSIDRHFRQRQAQIGCDLSISSIAETILDLRGNYSSAASIVPGTAQPPQQLKW